MALLELHDNVYDDGLNYLANNADQQVMCEGKPSDYSEATTDKGDGGVALGEDTPSFTGPEAGDTSGRKIQVDSLSGVNNDVTGVFDYIALVDDGNSDLLLAYPVTHEEITDVDTSGDVITIPGDKTDDLGADDYITVRESTGNDGIYTVDSVSVNGGGDTEITLNESISDSTADGYCLYEAQHISSGSTTNMDAFDTEIGAIQPE